ncbi:ferredoxin [Frankia sp. AgB32]|uniref:ferredoxin n=1 Tax=Frankia sp. AgB32 TaxID=631119 RepID=UPI00200F7CBD|nr:ferredoxin [Frankia sp. AgB32]MCK9898288.1 ferredoxin [Frankia sp. AgB32]
MQVVVNLTLCESNALCVGLAPSVFELDQDDVLAVLEEEPDEDDWLDVRAAAQACPKQAITLLES